MLVAYDARHGVKRTTSRRRDRVGETHRLGSTSASKRKGRMCVAVGGEARRPTVRGRGPVARKLAPIVGGMRWTTTGRAVRGIADDRRRLEAGWDGGVATCAQRRRGDGRTHKAVLVGAGVKRLLVSRKGKRELRTGNLGRGKYGEERQEQGVVWVVCVREKGRCRGSREVGSTKGAKQARITSALDVCCSCVPSSHGRVSPRPRLPGRRPQRCCCAHYYSTDCHQPAAIYSNESAAVPSPAASDRLPVRKQTPGGQGLGR